MYNYEIVFPIYEKISHSETIRVSYIYCEL